jgi:DNA-binding MarR family transcriptional regulator
MNAKKIVALTDEQIARIRELTAQKAEIDQELNEILGKKERRPRQKKQPLAAE